MAETPENVAIRQADTEGEDLREIIAMGSEMHATSSFSALTFDPRHFGMFVIDLIVGPQHVVYLAEVDGQVAGAVLASAVPSMIGPDLVASEHALYVRPEHRRSGAAPALIEAYVAWARQLGVKRVNVGNSAGMDDSRYVRLMQGHGFERAGSLLYMTI